MTETKNQYKEAERQRETPLPDGEKFFDPWEAEFRRSYKDDKAVDV